MFKYMETIAALNTCLLKQACDRFLGDDKDRNGQNGDDQYENQLEKFFVDWSFVDTIVII